MLAHTFTSNPLGPHPMQGAEMALVRGMQSVPATSDPDDSRSGVRALQSDRRLGLCRGPASFGDRLHAETVSMWARKIHRLEID